MSKSEASSKQPVALYLARRRAWRWAMAAVVVVAVGGLIWADYHGHLLYGGGDLLRYQGRSFRVAHVVKGDVLEVEVPDGSQPTTHVRLCGIVAPSPGTLPAQVAGARHAKKSEPFGPEAVDYAARLCAAGMVRLDLSGSSGRDLSGSLAAYVQLPDGASLNESLLAAGLARCDGSDHRLGVRYRAIEHQARLEGAGQWGTQQRPSSPSPPEAGIPPISLAATRPDAPPESPPDPRQETPPRDADPESDDRD